MYDASIPPAERSQVQVDSLDRICTGLRQSEKNHCSTMQASARSMNFWRSNASHLTPPPAREHERRTINPFRLQNPHCSSLSILASGYGEMSHKLLHLGSAHLPRMGVSLKGVIRMSYFRG